MRWLNTLLLLYALLTIALGASAYFFPREGHNPSSVSLIAGTVAGALILASVALAKTHPRWGRIMSLVLALLLTGRFAPEALRGSVYPHGIMFGASIIVIIALLAGHMMGMAERKKRESETPTAS